MEPFSPGYFRFGGTRSDLLFFQPDENSVESSHQCPPLFQYDQTLVNLRAPFEVQNITGAQFLNIYNGIKCAGLKLIFGLNLNNRVNGQWNSDNVELLLQFIKEHDLKLTLELGNEPNSYHHKFGYPMSPEQHMLDMSKLNDLLVNYNLSLPVFGPDSTGRSKQAYKYLDQFIQLVPSLEAYSYPHYSLSGYSSSASDYL